MDSFYSYNNAVQQSLGSYNTLHELAQEKLKEEEEKQSLLNTPLDLIGAELSQNAIMGLKKKAGSALSKVGFKGAGEALSEGGSLSDAISGGTKDVVNKVQDIASKGISKVTQAVTDASNTAQNTAKNAISKASQSATDASNTAQSSVKKGISKASQSATDAQSSAKSVSTDFTKSTATMGDPSIPTGGYSVGDATPSGKALRDYLQSDSDFSTSASGRSGSSMAGGQTGGDSTIARATQSVTNDVQNSPVQKITFDATDADPFQTPNTISSGITTSTVDQSNPFQTSKPEPVTTSTMDSPNTLTNQASKIQSADFESGGSHATGASGLLGEDATDDSLDTLTEASTAFDENPLGDVITAALGIASIFAPMFEHHQKQSPINPLNPSSQFGESE
jgi:hypothetical protein